MEILFEDKYLAVIAKPAGLMAEPDAYGHPNATDTLRELLRSRGQRGEIFLQPVHRLDRPVSGVMLFARKASALKALNEQFAERQVEKNYLAVTETRPEAASGTLSHYHHKDLRQKLARISDHANKNVQAVFLEYRILSESAGLYLWKIRLGTGRFHQIRAQLAHIGCPVIGDELYGSGRAYRAGAIALHAYQLGFSHPQTAERLSVTAPLPADGPWATFGETALG